MGAHKMQPTWEIAQKALIPPTVPAGARCETVLGQLAALNEWPSLPVFDAGCFVGLAVRTQLLAVFSNPLHHDLFGRKPVSRLMDPAPVVLDAACDVDEAIACLARTSWEKAAAGIVVFRDQDYCGLVLPSELLALAVAKAQWQIGQLEEASAAAVLANEAKSMFLATMSHEIRTPMNGIMGFANLLQSTPLDPTQKEYVLTIRESGDTLMAIINDVLDISKVEAGALELETESFSLASVVEGVMTLQRPRAQAKRLDLAIHYDPALPPMLVGDCGRIRQILMNLVGNAVKFTENGSIAVITTLDGHEPDGRVRVKISVIDTGLGIAEDQVARMFERFTQADSSTTRRFGGTGLGLAISKELAEAMGGSISVDSTPNKGSKFSLSLSLPISDAPSTDLSAVDPSIVKGRHILVVDDISVNRQVFTLILKGLGVQVTATPDAGSAMLAIGQARLNGARFDAAIIDHMMPDADGVQLAALLKTNPETAGLPLILSSSSDLVSEAQAQAWGFVARAGKPIQESSILKALAAAIALDAEQGRAGRDRAAVPQAPSTNADKASGAGRPPPPRAQAPAPGPADGFGLARILLAEDNPVNQKLVLAALAQDGVIVDVAHDGYEAVAAVETFPYDLVLMDIHMPNMNGVEATRRIRARGGRGAQIPILAMTANAMTGDRERYLAEGMDDYISKPVDLAALKKKVRTVIDAQRTLGLTTFIVAERGAQTLAV